MQSGLACGEKLALQNDSIAAYTKDTERKKAELYGKYKDIGRKYDELRAAVSGSPACEDKLKAVNEAQKLFLSVRRTAPD